MRIDNILLENFRCYSSFELSFNKNLTILFGPNGCGKTTILESIFMISATKSFKRCQEKDLISFNQTYYLIKSLIKADNKGFNVVIASDGKVKKIKRGSQEYKNSRDYLGSFDVILFSTQDFKIFTGSPQERRSFFDLVFCQISKFYMDASSNYKNLLKERNALLKRLYFENKSKDIILLDIVDERIIAEGLKIIKTRRKLIDKINGLLVKKHNIVASSNEVFLIEYNHSISEKDYKQAFLEHRAEDIKRGNTGFGVHKDDYIFIINNKNIGMYGSQGQQRNCILSLKMVFVELLKEVKGEYPVLLLDDVFSELDKIRQNKLVNGLNNEVQTIITTASLADLNESIKAKADIVQLRKDTKKYE